MAVVSNASTWPGSSTVRRIVCLAGRTTSTLATGAGCFSTPGLVVAAIGRSQPATIATRTAERVARLFRPEFAIDMTRTSSMGGIVVVSDLSKDRTDGEVVVTVLARPRSE